MAVLTAPIIDWATPANLPQAAGELVVTLTDPAVMVVTNELVTVTTFIADGVGGGTRSFGFAA